MAHDASATTSMHAPVAGMHRLHRFDRLIALALILVTFLVHWPYLLRDSFGEQDAARLANDAVRWHLTGQLSGSSWADYRVRSSPLYVLWLKTLISSGASDPFNLPIWMNWVSAVAGAAIAGALYLIARRLLPWEGACAAVGLTLLAPAVWQGSIYGMPHMPAYAFFLWGLVLFDVALVSTRPLAWLLPAFVLFVLTGLTKADVLLCGGAMIGLVLLDARRVARRIGWVVALGVATGLVCALLPQTLLSRGEATTAGFVGNWSSHFFIGLDGAAWAYNLRAVFLGGGVAALPAAAIGLVVLIVRKRWRVIWLACLWALPLVLFWLIIRGNSARHNMAAYFPLSLLVTGALWAVPMSRVLRVAIAVGVAAVSFLALPFSHGTRFPSGRLHASSIELRRWSTELRGYAARINNYEADKKAYVGKAEGEYVLFEALCYAKHLDELEPPPELMIANPEGEPAFMYRIEQADAPAYTIFFRHRPKSSEDLVELGRRLTHDGYLVFTFWAEFPPDSGVGWIDMETGAPHRPDGP